MKIFNETILFSNFVFGHECRSYSDAYTCALMILDEKPKKQWTPQDVIRAVLRAISEQEKSNK